MDGKIRWEEMIHAVFKSDGISQEEVGAWL